MKTMAAAKFKEQCLSVLDELSGEGLIITKRGVPVAHLTPVRAEGESLLGALAGTLTTSGDLLSTGVRWRAES